jgi:hypothetical protein
MRLIETKYSKIDQSNWEDNIPASEVAALDAGGPQFEARQRQIRLQTEFVDILACVFSEMEVEQRERVEDCDQKAA